MKPSKSYLAPRVSLLSLKLPFNVTEYLPPSAYCDRILAHYWDAVHPVARILHRPSFEKRWHIFFDDLQHHRKPVRSLVAIVFAVLFAGIAAMRPAQPIQFENRDQDDWLRRIQSGTELALEQAQMIQTAKVETMQAFTAYLVRRSSSVNTTNMNRWCCVGPRSPEYIRLLWPLPSALPSATVCIAMEAKGATALLKRMCGDLSGTIYVFWIFAYQRLRVHVP